MRRIWPPFATASNWCPRHTPSVGTWSETAVAQQRAHGRQVGRDGVVESAHRAAHHDDAVVAVQVGGQRVAGVERAHVQLETCRTQPVTEAGGRIGRVELNDENGHPSSLASGCRARREPSQSEEGSAAARTG